ncbi:MAG: DUF935 family protein [Bacteroidia bacterium]
MVKTKTKPAAKQPVLLKRPPKTSLIGQVVEQSRARTRKDINDWRKAINRAESSTNPRRDQLIQLFKEVELDNHITGLIEHSRKGSLLSEEFQVVGATDGKPDKELTQLFKSAWFYKFIKLALDSEFFGYSVLELSDIIVNERVTINLIPREHIVPDLGLFLKRTNDNDGLYYRDIDTVIEIGDPENLGLLNKAAQWFIYKKNAAMAWSEFCEIFGMPIRVGKTNSNNQEDINRMEKYLREMGSAAFAIFQEGEEIEVKETTRGDAHNVYNQFIERGNSEMSKLFVGNTMTNDVGASGSRAQAQVHENTGNNVLESDKRFITSVVNDLLFPVLAKYGWKLNGKKFEYPENKGLLELWDRTKEAMPFMEVDPKWIEDTFGVKILASKTPQQKQQGQLRRSIDELYKDYFTGAK